MCDFDRAAIRWDAGGCPSRRATDEADSKKAENVGKLPGKPTPEAVKRIEEIFKERNP